MAHFTTVFLSSTAKDLQPWRDAVAEAIAKLAGFHCVRMEDFGAVDAGAGGGVPLPDEILATFRGEGGVRLLPDSHVFLRRLAEGPEAQPRPKAVAERA